MPVGNGALLEVPLGQSLPVDGAQNHLGRLLKAQMPRSCPQRFSMSGVQPGICVFISIASDFDESNGRAKLSKEKGGMGRKEGRKEGKKCPE